MGRRSHHVGHDIAMNNSIECSACGGTGSYSLGDPEDGVDMECEMCDGTGFIEEGDVFVPKRDAWTPND